MRGAVPGVLSIRQTVAKFLLERDEVACDPKDLFLSNGASECIQHVLGAIIADPNVGIMIPIPQYPLCVVRSWQRERGQFITTDRLFFSQVHCVD